MTVSCKADHPLQVSVIVPVYNDRFKLERLLASFEGLKNPDTFEVLIVDDASTDDTRDAVNAWIGKGLPFPARLIAMERNGGPGRARNAGMAAAQAPVVAFTDSDCTVTPEWLEHLIAPLDVSNRIGGVAGGVRALSEGHWVARYNSVNLSLEPQWTPTYGFQTLYLVTCNCCYYRDALNEVGGFPEDISTPGGEDIAASILVWKKGWRFAYAAEALVYHDFRASIRSFARTFRNYGYGSALAAHRLLQEGEFHAEWGTQGIQDYWDATGLATTVTGVRSLLFDLRMFYHWHRKRGIGLLRVLECLPLRAVDRLAHSRGWRQGEIRYLEEQGRQAVTKQDLRRLPRGSWSTAVKYARSQGPRKNGPLATARRLLHACKAIREAFVWRWRNAGRRSAMAYAHTRVSNALVRVRNRVAWRQKVACPCCGWQGHEFRTIDCGTFVVHHAECPNCMAHERHRMLDLYLKRIDSGFFQREGRVLHFAPEAQVRSLIMRNPKLTYLMTDYALHMVKKFPDPGMQTDMQCIGLADNSLDALFCLHVLEHVPDDRKGIHEMHRVLKPGGVAYIMVPLMMEWSETVEFGAPDPLIYGHVRGYSANDFQDRLAPFEYEEIMPASFLSQEELRRHRIPWNSQIIYRCTKKEKR